MPIHERLFVWFEYFCLHMWPLYLKEIRSFLSSLIGYVVIGVFLLVTGIFLWAYLGTSFNIFQSGTASLGPLFALAPYVFLLLIPSITMRTFAEEKRVGTIELLMTKPLTDYQIIFSKFLAGFTLVLFSVLPTLTYYFCINDLKTDMSEIHTGEMWGSYIGLMFIGASYVAIGVFASSISSNQVVAFILTVVMCLFMDIGFSGINDLISGGDGFIQNLGIEAHYRSIQKGLVDSRDLVYFISLISIFIILTRLSLASRKW